MRRPAGTLRVCTDEWRSRRCPRRIPVPFRRADPAASEGASRRERHTRPSLKEERMSVWPSDEWIAEYKDIINASPEYKEAAHDWEGAVVYHFQAEPDKGLAEDVYGWFDLWHGECRDAKQVTADEAAKAEFVVSAPYSRWKQVIRKEVEPMRAVMQGHLKLKGDLPKAVRYTKA